MYMYVEDACHSYVTLSKIRELHNFATPQRLHLFPSRKILCIVAELPKVLRPKKERIKHLFCRWAAVWPCGIFLGSASGVGLH